MEFLVLVPVYAYEGHSVIGNGFHLPCWSRDPEVNNSAPVDCEEGRMKQITVSVRVLLIIVVLTNSFSWAKDKKRNPDEIGNRDVGKGVNFYSLEKEIAMGKQMAQEVERQAKIIDDPVIAEYINRVGQNLVRNSDAKVPFTIKVLDTEVVNA